MQTVYQAANGVEAQIVVDVLGGHGIEARVHGAGLLGAAGDLPAMGLVQVRVVYDAQAERAREIIREWEALKPEAEDEPADEAPAQRPVAARAKRLPWFVLGVALGGLVAALLVREMQYTREVDDNADGLVEVRWTWDGSRLARGELDTNNDGRIDVVRVYGSNSTNYLETDDRDFDGRFEVETRYRSDVPEQASGDLDGDGYGEYVAKYVRGFLAEENYSDPTLRNITLRWQYATGKPATSEIDSDGDGRLDTFRQHDWRGEIVSARPIEPNSK